MDPLKRAFLLFVGPLLIFQQQSPAQSASADLPRVSLPDAPALIYSTRPEDPWNKIFYFLFSRRLQVRLSNDFPEGAPFIDAGGGKISSRLFDRNETGDRAIDPMYPTFAIGFGSMLVLHDPTYASFTKCLKDALDDDSPRPLVARALMQNDLWSAYDTLLIPFLPDDEKALGGRRKAAGDLLGRLIRKIALSPDEIRSLPENYPTLVQKSFPDLFGKDGGWIEVQWILPRMHDHEAGYRRVSRVFLKPAHPPRDISKFLNSLSDYPDNPADLDGVALITQIISIDSQGRLQPTRLTLEAQVRIFDQGREHAPKATIKVSEISRRLFLQDPASGGLIAEDESAPTYAGTYRFAEGQLTDQRPGWGPPVQVKLRTRCAGCHGDNLQQIMTFSFIRTPHEVLPRIRQLNPAEAQVADFDILRKNKQADFKSLLQYFR